MKLKTISVLALLIVGAFLLWQYLPRFIPDNIGDIGGITDGISGITDDISGVADSLQASDGLKTDIVTTSDAALATMEFDILHSSMIDMMYEKALETYQDTGKGLIRVESYYEAEPVFALSLTAADLEDYVLEDIRSPEYAIASELPMFDVLVEDMTLTDTKADLTLDYMGAQDEFSDNVYAILLTVLEYAGWVDDIILNFRTSDGLLEISTAADSVTDSLNGGSLYFDHEFIILDKGTVDATVYSKGCPDDEEAAYQAYIEAYNRLTGLMNKGQGETPEAQEAYEEYKRTKECYDSVEVEPIASS